MVPKTAATGARQHHPSAIATGEWDVYLASRTAWVRTKLDCTHFCEPSGVLEAWTDRLLCVAPPVRALDVSGGG